MIHNPGRFRPQQIVRWTVFLASWALLVAGSAPLVLAAEKANRGKAAAPAGPGASLKALRLAIEDLIATFGPRYPNGGQYLARLAALEKNDSDANTLAIEALASEALLANPLLNFDKFLLVRREVKGDLGLTPNWGGKTDIRKTGYGNEIVLLSPVGPQGSLTTVFRPVDREYVGDLDLHWNADRLLFTMPSRKGAGPWNVYELVLDPATGQASGEPRQVTEELPGVDSYDGCYLPDGRVIFSSTAAQNDCPCWGRSASHSAAQLYLLDRTTGQVRQLCFDQDHNWCPAVMNDGKVLYQRWEYTDTPHFFTRLLFTMNPDGSRQTAYYGSNSYWPNAVFDARPIPGHPSLLVGVVGGHHGSARAGELVLFDAAKGQAEADGVVQRIPGFGKKVEPIIRDQLVDGSWPKFLHPFPLGEPGAGRGAGKYFLVACKLSPAAPWTLCLVDIFDNIVPVFSVPGSALLHPMPLRKRPLPPVIPDRVRLDRKDATVALSDVYAGPGLAGVPRGAVKQLRVFAYHYGYHGTGGHGAVGTDGGWDVKRILGTVPVHEDGSAYFTVPANTPISVQPLDGQGKALQLMRSWFTAMPGEHVSCVGCHERRAETLPIRSVAALKEPPSPIAPWRGPARGFSFEREVQPVLDKFCVGCHNDQPRPDGRPMIDLRGGRLATPDCRDPALGIVHPANCGCGSWHKWPLNRSIAYEIIHRYVRRPGAESDYHLLPPLEYHADTSELVQMLKKGHHGVELDAEAWDRLVTWIDLNVPYHGNWGEYVGAKPDAVKYRREYAKLFANLDDDPELLPPLSGEPVQPLLPPSRAATASADVKVPGWPFGGDEAKRRQQDAAAGLENGIAGQTELKFDLGDGLAVELVLIPAGEFLMGDPAGCDDERPVSRVRIERPFWMGKFEVTNEQYALFDPRHDSRYISIFGKDITVRGLPVNQPKQPVVRVPWTRAMQFCRWLSDRTGRRFSLPTEAQWEWACRGGSAEAMSYGKVDADFGTLANLADKRLVLANGQSFDWMPKIAAVDDGACVTAPVGKYAPNAWGLHDMHGNAAEWTRSRYRPYPYRDDGGRNDAAAETERVVRGGSFQDRPLRARSAFRLAYPAWSGVFNVGFRVACEVGQPAS
ncbi:MAG: SUMF1/EgtB/PvdO family nonheme iron enzyme [Thermoguttaceae bacterium]